MSKNNRNRSVSLADLPGLFPEKFRPPIGVVLGHPNEVMDFLCTQQSEEIVCYQMDLFPARKLRNELDEMGLSAKVKVSADLWDLDTPLQTIVYPASHKGERQLKLDMVDQAYQILKPHGILMVLSPYTNDQFFPQTMKKIFGKVHTPDDGQGTVFWSTKTDDKPRRRHELTYQVSRGEESSLRFLSRPGVFSYGRFDNGARALVEVMEIDDGDKILDLGCGCGTNGIHAGLQAGDKGKVTFLDSNLRALELAEFNAKENGLTRFETLARVHAEKMPAKSFDVVLANPPYFAQESIANMFINRSAMLLKPKGRMYLVTKRPNELVEPIGDVFQELEAVYHRGYTIFIASQPRP